MTHPPLTAQEYESRIFSTDRKSDKGSDVLPLLGLFGETGSLLSEVKKKQRDALSYVGYTNAVLEELGDVLWYVSTYARRRGLSLAAILDRLANGPPPAGRRLAPIAFAHFQHPRLPLPDTPTPSFERTLLELASSVGGLVAAHVGEGGDEVSTIERLEKTVGLLINAADEAGVTIEEAARHNIDKTTDRWPLERRFPPLLDADDTLSEQLHRYLQIEINESEVAGKTYVFQRCNGINIGDRLTDNSPVRDDYRFHDVFHYAYAAVIGWSPVVRSLFRLKRKSRPEIDEGEDSARPALIEEGIAAWIFNESTRLRHFEGLGPGDLPFGLLKRVREFVAPYEVGRCPLWVWEEAILQGFAAFRYLRDHRRGRLIMDLEQRRLSLEALPQ
jgi:NTP pyrophosphatase (non-canonical NTP hydrolase)